MDFEDALRLWGATTLTRDFSGLSLEDIQQDTVEVDIDTDPGCPEGEDSYYEPAKAIVTISAVLERSTTATRTRLRYWREKPEPESFSAGRRVSTAVEYPDMFGIAREANALANGEEI